MLRLAKLNLLPILVQYLGSGNLSYESEPFKIEYLAATRSRVTYTHAEYRFQALHEVSIYANQAQKQLGLICRPTSWVVLSDPETLFPIH